MLNWQNILLTLGAAVFGFLLRIIQEKILEKKVKLFHKLDTPAVFSVIPPKISFQNLKIANRGKLPAKNLKINLDADVIKKHDAIYKPITEEQYKEETREGVLTLKFDTLLPDEELVISFKSSEPIPQDFLINIKSDEMFSKKESEQEGKSFGSEIMPVLLAGIIGVLAMLLLFNYLSTKRTLETYRTLSKPSESKPSESKLSESKPSEQPAFSLSLMKDKSIYGKGQKAEVTCQIVNLKEDILRDIWGELRIPGFDLDTNQKYFRKNFLENHGQTTHKVTFNIPKDMPSGKYKITLEVYGKNLEKTFSQQTETLFEVQ